jgi:hypothetical protein
MAQGIKEYGPKEKPILLNIAKEFGIVAQFQGHINKTEKVL